MTENFTLAEMTTSEYAIRHALDNTPSPLTLERLLDTCKQMEEVRSILGNNTITVSSAYRSPTVNRAIGGSQTSAHCLGYAVDFTCHKFGTPYQVVKALQSSGLKYDQLIYEGTWVHISFDPRLRQQTLTAVFSRGPTVYKPFE